jgi:hypothetical protein
MTDGQPTPPPVPPATGSKQGEAVATVIPYRNPMALAAYYMGIFSLIPVLGIFLGAAAFICGIIGLRQASKHEGAHGRAHAAIGIGCGGIFFLLNVAGIVLAMFLAVSPMIH